MKPNLRFATLLLIAAVLGALAQPEALVEKKANLRTGKSSSTKIVTILLPGQSVDVLDASDARYAKVQTDDNKVGFVLKSALTIMPATPPTPTVPSGTSSPVTTGGTPPASAIDQNWPKQTPVTAAYVGSEGTCPAGGQGGDTPTNLLKNRSDDLPEAHDVMWSAIMALKYPAAPTMRSKWTTDQLAQIKPFEGVAIRTVGYLAHKPKIEDEGTGESTNCKFLEDADVDWHIYLSQTPSDTGLGNTVIVETTPRIRKRFDWSFNVLERYVGKGPVRISGFLMLDPEHRSQVGTARGTVWEIHPVTKIEVCDSPSCAESAWKDLNGLK
jgi:hypothetical protein